MGARGAEGRGVPAAGPTVTAAPPIRPMAPIPRPRGRQRPAAAPCPNRAAPRGERRSRTREEGSPLAMSDVLPISVFILTYNEAGPIQDCLRSLPPVSEVIVVDSLSDDGTPAIAESLGARVIQR